MKKFSKKLSICYQTTLNGGMFDNLNNDSIKEPINQLLNNIEEIKFILSSGKKNLFKFFYFNWETIDNILYEYDDVLDLEDNNNNFLFQLSELFYIDLIIMNKEVREFDYSEKFIKEINEIQQHTQERYNLKKLVWAKIIIDLINKINEENPDENILEEIKDNNKIIFSKNLSKFNNNTQNIENLLKEDTKIDEIYSFFLKFLIKNNNFADYEYVSSIFEQLEFKNIDLTITMFNELKNIFLSEDINKYKISEFVELINDNTKINFYYLLYEYILKKPFYLYQIDFFIDLRKIIISSLKTNPKLIILSLNNKNNKDKIRLIAIINFYTDSDFFYEKYLEEFEMLEIYNHYNLLIDFSEGINYSNEKTEDFNNKLSKLQENEIYNYKWKNIFLKYKKKLNELIEYLKQYLVNKNIIIAFYPKIINDTKKMLWHLSLFEKQSKGTVEQLKSFCLKIDLEKELNKAQGFLYLIKYIKKIIEQPISKKRSREDSLYSSSTSSLCLSNETNFYFCKFYKFSNIEHLLNNKNKYEILNIEKIICQNQFSVETILELNNFFLSIDINNNISLYDYNFHYINSNIPPIKAEESLKIKENDIIISSNNGVLLFKFNDNLPQIDRIIKLKDEPATVFFVMDNNMILGNKKNIKILSSSLEEKKVLNEIGIVAGIKVAKDKLIFISNSILSNGQDEIFLYDDLSENISLINLSDNYSFNSSAHNLELMPNKKGVKIFLLSGCKNKNKENGIIVFNIPTFKEIFKPTYNFEVYCFCPIFIIKEGKNKKIKNYYTNYFFAGGFDKNKFKGVIKLYKLITEEENDVKEIEFIQDINFEDKNIKKLIACKEKINDSGKVKEIFYNKIENYSFSGFEKNINNIIQSKKTGKILITCWDGNVFLLSEPNISIYLRADEKKKVNSRRKN